MADTHQTVCDDRRESLGRDRVQSGRVAALGCQVEGSELSIQELGYRIWGLGISVEDSGTRVEGLVFRGEDLGCSGHCFDDDNRKQGLGLRVEG